MELARALIARSPMSSFGVTRRLPLRPSERVDPDVDSFKLRLLFFRQPFFPATRCERRLPG
jgi:hypothetical protein